MDKKYYAKSLMERLDAVKNLDANVRYEYMPEGCRGSLNAWVVFLGSNPGGGAQGDKDSWKSGLGKGLGEPFLGDRRRNVKWMKLFLAVLQDNSDAVNQLSALYNLSARSTKRESDLRVSELDEGCETVWAACCRSRPRFVVALTKSTYFSFGKFIKAKTNENWKEISADIPLSPAIEFKWPDVEFYSYLVRSPRHPSWPTRVEDLLLFRAQIEMLDKRN